MEKGLEIEIFEIGGALCPVKAWRRYVAMAGNNEPELPAFRQEGGLAYSHSMFNKDLRTLIITMACLKALTTTAPCLGVWDELGGGDDKQENIAIAGRDRDRDKPVGRRRLVLLLSTRLLFTTAAGGRFYAGP